MIYNIGPYGARRHPYAALPALLLEGHATAYNAGTGRHMKILPTRVVPCKYLKSLNKKY